MSYEQIEMWGLIKLFHGNDPKNTAKLRQNGWRIEELGLDGLVKVQTSTQLKCCGGTLRMLCINECPKTSVTWSNVVKKNEAQFLLNHARDWYSPTGNDYFKYLLLNVRQQAAEPWGSHVS